VEAPGVDEAGIHGGDERADAGGDGVDPSGGVWEGGIAPSSSEKKN